MLNTLNHLLLTKVYQLNNLNKPKWNRTTYMAKNRLTALAFTTEILENINTTHILK